MLRKIVCFVFLMSVCLGTVFSQTEKSEKTVVKDNKLFYVHEVVKGQTLYRLSKMYQVSIEDITAYNPSVQQGIKIADTLYIPAPKQAEVKAKIIDSLFHTVDKRETLYSIAKKYETTVEAIKKANPNLNETLTIGQRIYIPVIVNVTSEKKEGKETLLFQGVKKGDYTVYLLMPLYLSESELIETSKVKSLSDYAAIKPFSFIQFYEAMLLAAEDISQKYPQTKIYLHVEDITNAAQLTELTKSGKLDNADMIIGPFQGKEFSVLCQYAQSKDILLVNPFSTSFETANSLTYRATTLSTYSGEAFANYVLEKYPSANILFANNQSQEEIKQIAAYRSGMQKVFGKSDKHITVQEVNIKGSGISAIKSAMNAMEENFVFTFFEGELMVTNFIQNLHAAKTENLTLVAPEKWLDYDNIETEYFMHLKTHYISQYFVDYSHPKVIRFIDAFRNAYDTEPTLALYAFQGYDFTYYFLSKLCETGTTFQPYANNENLLSTKFHFVLSPATKNMLENTFVHIFKLKNYKYIDAFSDNEANMPKLKR